MDLTKGKLIKGHELMGATAIYVADEQNRILHTEPVCTVYEKWHPAFVEWLLKQSYPIELPARLD